ncbi:CHASE2 domain-containing protein [Leptolyngbya sp. FACHB-36]|uniref:CHASE2 domain-containing protein n=1 Tax=Leptolyngbya sp. FACHB-36 TaxID=2692808 RepID=UPI0016804C9E|nr:CHASE2 domain-containing protein [Leptolyngbya sp. FACHB-36]MBD2021594.1 CHASE2 domain-containing protein [Leptolyngbya sp. FACHB-36]
MTWRFGKYGRSLLPGGLTTLVLAVLLNLGALQSLEHLAYNTLLHLRGQLPWDDRLVLIAIDDVSIRSIGRFPWARQQYVNLLGVLAESDPSVIVMDLVWSERSPDDTALAQAMSQSSRVVLATAQDSNGLPLPPVPELANAAIASGHIINRQDDDGITRKVDLQIRNEPALALAAVQSHSLVQTPISLPNPEQPLWINWAGRVQQLRQYSFADVVQRKISADAFRDKIVLVGVTAVGIDAMPTPFNQAPPASGVYLHAAVIHTLLQQNALKPLGDGWLIFILLAGGPGLNLILVRWRENVQLLIWLSVCLSWIVLSWLLLKLNYWSPVALPIALFTSTAVAVAVGERLRLNVLLQQQVRQLWQRHYSDVVLRGSKPDRASIERSGLLSSSPQSVTQLAALADQFGRSQSTQAAIARSLSIGLLAADWSGVVWFCNPVAADWLHVSVNNNLTDRLVPNWLSEDQWQADLQALRQLAQVAPRELHRDDRWFELKLELLTDRSNQLKLSAPTSPDGFLLLLEDITLRKQVEETLAQQVQELQRLSQLKDDFLSTVSHELRAPLTNIKLAIELLKLADSDKETQYYISVLENECNREANLINDLLDLQRLEAKAQTFTPTLIDLRAWLPTIVAPFYERAAMQQQTLHLDLPPETSCLTSDQLSLERILTELINNACKYTPPDGSISVSVDCRATDLDIAVQNTGCEIPERELNRIFEKFYRIPKADPWKRGGTGLGLALVKRLVEYLGGTIRVQSGSGQITFVVQLPLKYEPKQEPME